MQRMAELRKGIRDEHLNAEALAEMMKDQDVSSALDDVERLMREGKADEALAKLQELSMQMDEMLQRLNKAQEEFGGEQYPELAAEVRRVHERPAADDARSSRRWPTPPRPCATRPATQNKDRLTERARR